MDDSPTPGDIAEFGDPSENATNVNPNNDETHDDPDAIFSDEEPDLGLE